MRISAKDLDPARALRSAIWRIAGAVLGRTIPDTRDVHLLNATACEPGLVKKFGSDVKLSRWHRLTLAAALAPLPKMPSCFLEIPSSGLGSIAAKTRDAKPFSMTIPSQDSGAGVLQPAAANGFEPKFIKSDTDHDALNETNAMAPAFSLKFRDAPGWSANRKDTIGSPGITCA